ncbi:MAG: VOC family protein [Parvularculaceae bacterium]
MISDDFSRRSAIGLTIGAVALGARASAAEATGAKSMERVAGIGGFFFRAKDPKSLAKWYEDNLGVTMTPEDYESEPWRQEAGTTVFAPFREDTDYFGDKRLQWMINFRVRSIDRMAAQLAANGVAVEIDPETYPNGRFGKLNDPEGNPIQLWEPGGVDRG